MPFDIKNSLFQQDPTFGQNHGSMNNITADPSVYKALVGVPKPKDGFDPLAIMTQPFPSVNEIRNKFINEMGNPYQLSAETPMRPLLPGEINELSPHVFVLRDMVSLKRRQRLQALVKSVQQIQMPQGQKNQRLQEMKQVHDMMDQLDGIFQQQQKIVEEIIRRTEA